MRIIALDASTELCSVALGDGKSWRERTERAGQRHSELLLPMVQELLAEARLKLSELDGIAFGAGPGSFTGLRIACGVAQGLALGGGLKVVGVSTLEAMAEMARQHRGAERVMPALDARMHEVYLAAYEHDGTRWHEIIEASAVKPDAVPLPPGGSWVGAGAGFAAYPELPARLGRALAARHDDITPTAAAIGALALRRFRANEGISPRDAAPLYVRQRVALTAAERAAGLRL
ncbi:MAG TPA: tRNA (adenosine(37)-N6)-threonylcarbamoyltransferase complex dimerization subunit type 1 TsaB [Casimicrobiaceae bacterium]|jgi:tRNA threonylcarbamoyladenosine biosynthesis protein TsaB|nr:tRNA (adenosine(37)-N6)-threonylcarbamoyltransferase complex dimerization subunit type 1 TsaB [Casimicrobiaceae bacterium]